MISESGSVISYIRSTIGELDRPKAGLADKLLVGVALSELLSHPATKGDGANTSTEVTRIARFRATLGRPGKRRSQETAKPPCIPPDALLSRLANLPIHLFGLDVVIGRGLVKPLGSFSGNPHDRRPYRSKHESTPSKVQRAERIDRPSTCQALKTCPLAASAQGESDAGLAYSFVYLRPEKQSTVVPAPVKLDDGSLPTSGPVVTDT